MRSGLSFRGADRPASSGRGQDLILHRRAHEGAGEDAVRLRYKNALQIGTENRWHQK